MSSTLKYKVLPIAVAIVACGLAVTTFVFGLPMPSLASADDGGSAIAESIKIQAAEPDQICTTYPVVLDDKAHHRLISTGLTGETPEAMFEEVKAAARKDPVYLAAAYNFIFEGTQLPPLDLTQQATYDKLAQGGCYTLAGVELYNQVLGRFSRATVTAAEAPADGVNSGAVPGGGAFADAGGIDGDRAGIAVTFDDGKVIYVMKRCGNFVKPGGAPPVGMPSGKVPAEGGGGGGEEGGGPSPTTGPPPVTTRPKPGKCDGQGEFCGTPLSGPEQQPLQDNDPAKVAPTPGYSRGNAEAVDKVQKESQKAPTYQPTPKGREAPGGAPAGHSDGPSGGKTGTSGGTKNPTPTEGSGQVSSGDPGEP